MGTVGLEAATIGASDTTNPPTAPIAINDHLTLSRRALTLPPARGASAAHTTPGQRRAQSHQKHGCSRR